MASASRRTVLQALGSIVALGTLDSERSSGQTAPKQVARRYLENDDLLDNAELERALGRLADRASDRVSLREIGSSNQNRPIHAVEIGSGDEDVVALGQQHGDEMIAPAEGLLSVASLLARDGRRAGRILDEVTLHLVPRVNPDGFVARQRWNVDTSAPARSSGTGIFSEDGGFFTANRAGVGWDVNRYHWLDWTESPLYREYPDEYARNPVPEARAVAGLVTDVDPDWILDYHRQGIYTVDEDATFDPENPEAAYQRREYPPDPDDDGGGDVVTTSLFWPIHEDVPEETRGQSKRLAWTIHDGLGAVEGTTVSRYPGGTHPGITRNAYGRGGYPTVLFEVSAGTLGDRAFRIRQVVRSVLAATTAIAEGSVDDVDADNVRRLPERHVDGFIAGGGEGRRSFAFRT